MLLETKGKFKTVKEALTHYKKAYCTLSHLQKCVDESPGKVLMEWVKLENEGLVEEIDIFSDGGYMKGVRLK